METGWIQSPSSLHTQCKRSQLVRDSQLYDICHESGTQGHTMYSWGAMYSTDPWLSSGRWSMSCLTPLLSSKQ